MGDIISAAKVLQAIFGGLVLLVHHSGKDQAKGLRGHSSLTAALDAAIEVIRNDDRRSWRIAKSKDDSDSATHFFRLDVVEIAKHDDGEPITSCVVVPDKADCDVRSVFAPKAGNQKIGDDALREMLAAAGPVRPVDAPERLPGGKRAVRLDTAIATIASRLVCDPKRRFERAKDLVTRLHFKGRYVIDGGYVWMT